MSTELDRRFAYIDALRGMACIWVMIHHTLEHFPVADGWVHWPLRFMVAVADYGWLGVSLFLVLSGFCLYFPMMRRGPAHSARVDIVSFAWRRARRILPPYYAALVLSAVLIVAINFYRGRSAFDGLTAIDIARHVLLLHNLWPESFASINGVFWSLALEAQLYVIFPLLVYLIARRGFTPVVAAVFILSLGWQTVACLDHGLSLQWTEEMATTYHALPARAFEFLAGMVAAHFVSHPRPNQGRIAIVLVAALIVPAALYAGWVSRFGPFLDQMWGVIFAALIVAVARVSNRHFEFPSVLGALTWVGVISFSIYLIHRPLFRLLPWREYSDIAAIAMTFARILVGIGVGYGFHLLFERPFMRRSRGARMPGVAFEHA